MREGLPNEVCGLLVGRDGIVSRVFRCANVHETPLTRYRMDPRDQLRAYHVMEEAGEALVAIYHSHPVTRPYPSETDRAEAYERDALYVLLSLRTGAPEIKAYALDGPEVREVPVEISGPV